MKHRKIIFFDTEFSSLDPNKGEILSVGLVKENGNELYLELECEGEISQWAKENILPTLQLPKVSREEACNKIREFAGNDKPVLMAYVNQFDILYLYKLFGVDDCPFFWMPLDFASILYAHGYNPLEYYEKQKEFAKKFGLDAEKYHQHHALDDARLVRDTYLKLKEKSKETR